jgi:hypothetical protein
MVGEIGERSLRYWQREMAEQFCISPKIKVGDTSLREG